MANGSVCTFYFSQLNFDKSNNKTTHLRLQCFLMECVSAPHGKNYVSVTVQLLLLSTVFKVLRMIALLMLSLLLLLWRFAMNVITCISSAWFRSKNSASNLPRSELSSHRLRRTALCQCHSRNVILRNATWPGHSFRRENRTIHRRVSRKFVKMRKILRSNDEHDDDDAL